MKKPTTHKDMAGPRKPNLSAEAQQTRILDYLKMHSSGINRYEAEKLLSVCQLAARIFELKERGYLFLTATERATDPHCVEHEGIARYFLTHEAANDAEGQP